MDEYFNIRFDDFSNYNKFRALYPHKYGIKKDVIWFKIIATKKYYDLIKYIDPYEYIYPSKRNMPRIKNIFQNISSIDDINKDIINLLLYKIKSNDSLFFWEINHTYKLINNNTKIIYDINNISSIHSACVLINDKYNPLIKFNYTQIIPSYVTNDTTNDYIKQNIDKTVNNIFAKTSNEYINILDNIDTIDLLYINIRTCFQDHIHYKMADMFENFRTYTIFKLCDKININGNLCITYGLYDINISTKIITLISHIFEKYYIILPETNRDRSHYHYVIFINKKQDVGGYSTRLNNVSKYIENNSPDMYVIDKCIISNNMDILNSKNKFICKIKLLDNELLKKYKKIKKICINANKKFLGNLHDIYNQLKYVIMLQNKNLFTEEIKQQLFIKNMYTCLQWSNKYEFPIIDITNFNKVNTILTKDILSDMFSYDNSIYYTFSKYATEMINIKPGNNTIPDYYNKIVSKSLEYTRALDNRDMNIYHQVKLKIDYYHKKLIGEIKKKNKINDFVSQAWLKLFEIYTTIDIIPKNQDTYKTFHFCELPGSFVYATKYYIENKTNIKNWIWNAQSLNPYQKRKDDERVAFGDDGNILKKYFTHYDFGPHKTGDINNPDNLEYYKNKYGDNDFVTADCGLPLNQKDLSYQLTYSMYISVFSTLKKGGSCIIKRHVPVSDNQEITLLYIAYNSFDKLIMFKPSVNQQSQEYYLICIDFKGIDSKIMDILIKIHKNYENNGLVDINNISEKFLVQLYKYTDLLLDNQNKFIKNKIYFADNFNKITKDDWQIIKEVSNRKIIEWMKKTGLSH